MDSLYRTPTKNGMRALDSDEVSAFLSPSKGLIDDRPERWRDPTPTSHALPNSNRDNVVDALKNIQGRIRNLELERNSAEDNLKELTDETQRYRRLLDDYREDRRKSLSPRQTSAVTSPRHYNHDLHEQLRSADTRCELLDKQLEYMRRMLNEAEAEKRLAVERTNQMMNMRSANNDHEMRKHMSKVEELEREHERLQTSQQVAQGRIKDLEREIDRQRELGKAARQHTKPLIPGDSDLLSAQQANEILVDKMSPPVSPRKEKPERDVNRRGKSGRRSAPPAKISDKTEPGVHYRLNMADIPFVVGQSTAPSHRLGSNVQNVIAAMKRHNPHLCAAAVEAARPRSSASTRRRRTKRSEKGTSESSESDIEINEMVGQLIEEYTHLGAEHMELSRQLAATTNSRLADEIQSALDHLKDKMNVKADQIAKLSHFRAKVRGRKKKNSSNSSSGKSEAARRLHKNPSSSTTGEVQVTTTIKTKGKHSSPTKVTEVRPRSREANLHTLNNMKTLNNRLRPDELRWTS